MTLHEIEKRLSELQPEFAAIKDPGISVLITELMALLESCYSIATVSTVTIQQLKGEINRLKGEYGKAKIKADTGSSYSTEKERKAAEASLVPTEIGFKLTKDKLKALGEKIVETYKLLGFVDIGVILSADEDSPLREKIFKLIIY